MKIPIQKINTWTKAHKIMSVVILLALIGMGYGMVRAFGSDSGETRYVLATVERGNIVASVTGSGQVSSSYQVDLKTKASGDLTTLNMKTGQEVAEGAVVANVNARDALQNVRDMQTDLTSAKISLEKAKISTIDTKKEAEETLEKAYQNGYGTLTDTFTDYSNVIDEIRNIYYEKDHSPYFTDDNLRFEISYNAITEKYEVGAKIDKIAHDYDALFIEYKKINSTSSREEIERLVNSSYIFSKKFSDVLKEFQALYSYLEVRFDTQTDQFKEDRSSVNGYIATVNEKTTELLSFQEDVKNAKSDVEEANRTYSEISGSSEPLDVQTAQLTVTQKQNAYQKALNELSDYTVKTPFAGLIASVSAKKGDSVSSGTTIATLITKKKIAEISLNEIDVAKIKAGQKATLAFDAFEDLTIMGEVAEIDLVGTVSQGVVNYTVKITFDTDDSKVKPGMTVNASIVTDMKQNALMVPTSAVKSQGGISYVEVADQNIPHNQVSQAAGVLLATPPRRVEVTTGFTNDESIEIVSGLEEGQQYVARTITTGTTSTQATQSAPSLFGGGATGRPTGGGTRTFTR
ncbi:MAG: hypothetical protein A3G04_01130 [Candidatus Taylorbacteria bacterium RIFCSPLOWO2_12_FULL_44_9]|nr:MAG: hypothetical protein A3G04_01130 [Candidatus Taylorbacteria bacterium RIFCSPLOWO2_12_FULL_44_9]